MMDLDLRRRFFAEELEAVCKLRSPALVEAFATVPRERFLGTGPMDDSGGQRLHGRLATRPTPDADAGASTTTSRWPSSRRASCSTVSPARSACGSTRSISRRGRVLHVGCGLGYYTAVMAQCVGPRRPVVAFEVDETLAWEARRTWRRCRGSWRTRATRRRWPARRSTRFWSTPASRIRWTLARCARYRRAHDSAADRRRWGPRSARGWCWLLTKEHADRVGRARLDHGGHLLRGRIARRRLNDRLGKAMSAGPAQWPSIKRLRRDPHDLSASCWLHADTFCLSR